MSSKKRRTPKKRKASPAAKAAEAPKAAKLAAKPAAKPTKPAPKATAKSTSQPATKLAAKPKPKPRAAVKPAAKASPAAKAPKPAAKPAAKPTKPAPKSRRTPPPATPPQSRPSRTHTHRRADTLRFVLPTDVARKRIFWALLSIFAALLAVAVILVILLLSITIPEGFETPVRSPESRFAFSFYGSTEESLSRPSGIAISPAGELYVADTGNARVAVFDREGNYLREIKYAESAATEAATDEPAKQSPEEKAGEDVQTSQDATQEETPLFQAPTSLAFASDGSWFVVDSPKRQLLLFASDDRLVRALQFEEESPSSVKVNRLPDGREQLFVTSKSGVAYGEVTGTLQGAYLNWGHGSGQVDNPTAALVFDPTTAQAVAANQSQAPAVSTGASSETSSNSNTGGFTLICDVLNYRVQAFQSFETSPVLAWVFGDAMAPVAAEPLLGDGAALPAAVPTGSSRKLGLPVDMALSPEGKLFVLDGLSSEIIVLKALDGSFAYTISDVGSGDGLLYYPAAIAYGNRKIYVADKFNDRVSVFDDLVSEAPPPAPKVQAPTINRWWFLTPCVLLACAALLRLLLLRTPRYVVDLSFLESVEPDQGVQRFIIEQFRYLSIPAGSESLAQQVMPGYPWRSEAVDEAQEAKLAQQESGLQTQELTALALASKSSQRTWLMTASRELEQAAKRGGIKTLRFAEFRALAHAMLGAEHWEEVQKSG